MSLRVHKGALAGTILTLSLIAGACTSIDSVRNSREVGYAHKFAAPYGEILKATPPALAAVKLETIDAADPEPGTHVIMARRGLTVFHWGEYVRVTIRELGPNMTEVAILTRNYAALASTASTPEYYGDLLLEIGKRVLGT